MRLAASDREQRMIRSAAKYDDRAIWKAIGLGEVWERARILLRCQSKRLRWPPESSLSASLQNFKPSL